MSTLTTTRSVTLPRVDLLPPEIGDQRRLRKVQAGLLCVVVAAAGVVGLLFLAASNEVSAAEEELTATQAEGSRLQVETNKYAAVPAVIAKVDAAKLQRSEAMAHEVRWSYYLNDLSLSIPGKVWLTGMTVTQNVDTPAAAPVEGAAATYPDPGIGQVTFEGKAYGHNNVATWLNMLAKQKGWADPYFNNSTEDPTLVGPGGEPTVTFSSQVTITEEALSRRFDQKAGE
jgi:Tfp pilus assembly protein PilN